MSLSPEQFAEHLAGLESATGIQYHPGGMTLPSGLRVPAMHSVAMAPSGEGRLGGRLEVASYLPSETGALHHVRTAQFPEGDFMLEHASVPSVLRASEEDFTSGRIRMRTFRSAHPPSSTGDWSTTGDWSKHVERSLMEDPPPSPAEAAKASDLVKKIGQRTQGGDIVSVWDSNFDARGRKADEPDFEFDLRSR